MLHPCWITLMSVPVIYFNWGRILRKLNTCSSIAYITYINSDWCMSSLIMYLQWCKCAVFPASRSCTKFWWCYLGEPSLALPGNYDLSINLHSPWRCWAQTTLQWFIGRQSRRSSLSSSSQRQQLAGFHIKCTRWAAKTIKRFKKLEIWIEATKNCSRIRKCCYWSSCPGLLRGKTCPSQGLNGHWRPWQEQFQCCLSCSTATFTSNECDHV